MAEKEAKKAGKKKKSKRAKSGEKWSLYVLRCGDGSFYTGITNGIDRRFKMHAEGKGAKYTRSRRPLELLYEESCGSRTQALVRECAVKALPRKRKEKLIAV